MNYILSNILFGYPKMAKYQIEYFDNYFVPLIQKRGYQEDDKIIITGNIFYNTSNVSFELLSKAISILNSLSSCVEIEIMNNEYCENIIKKENITFKKNSFYDNVKLNLFGFKKSEYDIGFEVVKDGEIKFVENKKSPRFVECRIDKIEDITNMNIDTKNFIDITINSDLLDTPEHKNLINIFLSKNIFNNVYYSEKSEPKRKDAVMVEGITNIRDIIMNNIDEDLKDDMMNIFKLSDGVF